MKYGKQTKIERYNEFWLIGMPYNTVNSFYRVFSAVSSKNITRKQRHITEKKSSNRKKTWY